MPDDHPPPALPDSLSRTPIRLLVADIDGCLCRGTGHAYNHTLLQRLATINAASRTDDAVPAVTFCTGRPQPYVECLLQVIDGRYPALCESGTVLFDLDTHSIVNHPDFTPQRQKMLASLRADVEKHLGKPNVKPEPGKVSHITLIIQPPDSPAALLARAQELVDAYGDTFYIEQTSICLHFLFRDIHKGTGLTWLSQHTGIPLQQMAAIGDSTPDIPFLQMAGFAFAPANARQAVKDCCHAVSRFNDADAASELIELLIAHNKRIKQSTNLDTTEVTAG